MIINAIPMDMPWTVDALCAGLDPELFFPRMGQPNNTAKAICRRCPVRQQCLDYAVDHAEPTGIWGGMSQMERRRIRKGRNL